VELLEKLKQLTVFIERNMGEIRLNLHSEPDGPFTGNGAFKSSVLMPGYSFGSLTNLYFSGCYVGCSLNVFITSIITLQGEGSILSGPTNKGQATQGLIDCCIIDVLIK